MQKKAQSSPVDLRQTLREIEVAIIHEVLTRTQGNVMRAAKLLQIPRATLIHKMKRFGILAAPPPNQPQH